MLEKILEIASDEIVELIALPSGKGPIQVCYAHGSQIPKCATEGDALGGTTGVYICANRIDPAVAARYRRLNHWQIASSGRASDADITHRRCVYIDVDAPRVRGVSATDDELAIAKTCTRKVLDVLRECGVPVESRAVGLSGNGYCVLIQAEPVEESEKTLSAARRIVESLRRGCGKTIDVSVYNASRLIPMFGTVKKKGANLPGRPWRKTNITTNGDRRLGWTRLTEVADQLESRFPPERPAPRATNTYTHGESNFEKANNVPIETVLGWLGTEPGSKRDRWTCPGCNADDAMVAGNVNKLKCFHNSCKSERDGLRGPVDVVVASLRVSPVEAMQWVLEHANIPLARKPRPDLAPSPDHAPKDPRSIIYVSIDESVAIDGVLDKLDQLADVYDNNGIIVKACPDGVLRAMDRGGLRYELARTFKFHKRNSSRTQTKVPPAVLDALLGMGSWQKLRTCRTIVRAPVLGPDGHVRLNNGYDPSTQTVVAHNLGSLTIGSSQDSAAIAAHQLLELVGDFPFASTSDASAWLAGLLTPFARYAFAGPAPLTLVDGNAPGVGKSRLVQLISLIFRGATVPPTPEPEDDAEQRKMITSHLVAGSNMIFLDNLSKKFGGAPIEALLTDTHWTDRMLGRTQNWSGDSMATWYATGNNVAFRKRDVIRRISYVRVESPVENPETRTGFRIADLQQHVLDNRARYVEAALTILRAYCAAGRPNQSLPPWGSFEGWSNLVRSAIVFAGCADPATARELMVFESASDESGVLDLFDGLRGLGRQYRDGWVTTHDIVRELRDDELLARPEKYGQARGELRWEVLANAVGQLCGTRPGVVPSVRQLGAMLSRYRSRVVAGLRLRHRRDNGNTLWSIGEVAA
jgi:hypothetical protein